MRYGIRRCIAALFAVILTMINMTYLAVSIDAADADNYKVGNVDAYYLYNFENDRVLAESGADKVLYPASTVKIMTGIVAAETFADDLDRQITVTSEIYSEIKKVGTSYAKLGDGEIVSVKDMLYACLIGGDNGSACVLAYAVAGGIDEFVTVMNEKAALLGALDTNYTNPTGLHDDNMVTTIGDTAKIAKHAANNAVIAEIVATPKYVMETNLKEYHTIYNRNCLISKYYNTYDAAYRYEPATGMNAGMTLNAGNVVVSTAKNKDGDLTYLAIAMGDHTETHAEDVNANYAYESVIALFEQAFAEWGYIDVLSTDKIICEVPVSLSSAIDHVTLSPKEKIRVYLPTSTDIDKDIEYSYTTMYETMPAPVKMGEVVGNVTVMYKGEVLGSAELITTVEIERSELLYTLSQIEEFTKSKFFIGTVVSAVVLTVAYVLVNARIKSRSRGF